MSAGRPRSGWHAPGRSRATLVLMLGVALGGACSRAEDPGPREPDGPPGEGAAGDQGDALYHGGGPFLFRDATTSSGLGAFEQVNGDPEKPYLVETVGGGVALFDSDADGDLDAYLTNGGWLGGAPGGRVVRDALYLNQGDGRFVDGTQAAGIDERRWSNGVLVGDLDGDTRPDLYITNYGPNTLYLNRGENRFEDGTGRAGLGDPAWSTGAALLDFDRDGDLDVYVVNYVDFDEASMLADRPTIDFRGVSVMKGPRGLDEAQDTFWRNDGDGRFQEATTEVGLAGHRAYGFQSLSFDSDVDGWVDVYVANDSVPNYLWLNREGRTFEDGAVRAGAALSSSGQPQAGMGVGLGDFDGDLEPDLFVTNFSDDYFTVYRGRGRGLFLDVTPRLELTQPTKEKLGWGCGFADFNSDGVQEIFAVNGHVYPQIESFDGGLHYRQRNQLFEYVEGRFRQPEGLGGPGFALRDASRGAAVGDVDGDGDLDLLIGNLDGPPTLLRNDGPQGNWIQVTLRDRGMLPEARGARVVVEAGGRRQLGLVGTGASFLSSWDPRLHFGLGANEKVERVSVTWPDGETEAVGPLAAGATWRIERQSEGSPRAVREP